MPIAAISPHLCRVYQQLKVVSDWRTAAQIGTDAQVNTRTARAHLTTLTEAGIAEQAEVFPAYRYRLSVIGKRADSPLSLRLNQAMALFGYA